MEPGLHPAAHPSNGETEKDVKICFHEDPAGVQVAPTEEIKMEKPASIPRDASTAKFFREAKFAELAKTEAAQAKLAHAAEAKLKLLKAEIIEQGGTPTAFQKQQLKALSGELYFNRILSAEVRTMIERAR